MRTKLNIEDYLFISQKAEDLAIEKCVPAEFTQLYVDRFNSGAVKNKFDICTMDHTYANAEDYARQWAWEIAYHLYEDAVQHCILYVPEYGIQFEFTDAQKKKWKKIWKDNTKWLKNDDLEWDDDHITTTTECESAEEFISYLPDVALRVYWFMEIMKALPASFDMQPIWDLHVKYRKEAHAVQDRINGKNFTDWYMDEIVPWMEANKNYRQKEGSKYRNWNENEPIPEGMIVYKDVWVIPEFLEEYMPPDDILNDPSCQVVYLHDDDEYDLFTHKYDEGEYSDMWRLIDEN